MLTPIEDEPPVKGPSTPILIGSAAHAAPATRAHAAAMGMSLAVKFKAYLLWVRIRNLQRKAIVRRRLGRGGVRESADALAASQATLGACANALCCQDATLSESCI